MANTDTGHQKLSASAALAQLRQRPLQRNQPHNTACASETPDDANASGKLGLWSIAADYIKPGLVRRNVRYRFALSQCQESHKDDRSRAERIGVTYNTLRRYIRDDAGRSGTLDLRKRHMLAEIVCGNPNCEPWLSKGYWQDPISGLATILPHGLEDSGIDGLMSEVARRVVLGNALLAVYEKPFLHEVSSYFPQYKLIEGRSEVVGFDWPTWDALVQYQLFKGPDGRKELLGKIYTHLRVLTRPELVSTKDAQRLGLEPDDTDARWPTTPATMSLSLLCGRYQAEIERSLIPEIIARHPKWFQRRLKSTPPAPMPPPKPAPSPPRRSRR